MVTRIYLSIVLLLIMGSFGLAQSPTDDGRGVLPSPDDPNRITKNVKEMLDKMKIEEEKKDYD